MSPGGVPGTLSTGWSWSAMMVAMPGSFGPSGKRGGRPASRAYRVATRE
jgi:hypothetical protein